MRRDADTELFNTREARRLGYWLRQRFFNVDPGDDACPTCARPLTVAPQQGAQRISMFDGRYGNWERAVHGDGPLPGADDLHPLEVRRFLATFALTPADFRRMTKAVQKGKAPSDVIGRHYKRKRRASEELITGWAGGGQFDRSETGWWFRSRRAPRREA